MCRMRGTPWLALLAALGLVAPLSSAAAEGAKAQQGMVVLLHGLARSASSMEKLEVRLKNEGFETHNLDYPSTDHTPDELVSWLDAELERCCDDPDRRLHFVTHSLGGILARAQLERERPAHLGRVVLIAPPNKGSEIVDSVGGNPIFRSLLGPTAAQLGTGPDSFPNSIGEPDYELGIIAGNQSLNPVGSAMLPEPNDGAVSLERTRLEGAADFILVDANHTFIMQEDEVARQVIRFLRTGHFDHGRDGSAGDE